MITFLFGKENFNSQRKLQKTINELQETIPKLYIKYFDAEKSAFQDFRDQFQTKSIFKEKNLFILKNVFSNQDFKQSFLKSKIDFPKSSDIIIFYERDEVEKADPFFIFLKKNAKCQEFDSLKKWDVKKWLNQEMKKHQLTAEPDAIQLLLELTNNNLWHLQNEVEKLAAYFSKSDKRKILKKDIEILVPSNFYENIFKLIDAIALKNKEKAFILLKQHLLNGAKPPYLLSMFAYQFRNILIMKEKLLKNGSIKGIKGHPFVLRKTQSLCERFSMKDLKRIYPEILKADINIKTGEMTPETGLNILISKITKETP